MADPSRPPALVTGGSRGIGFELARRFASDGYDLILAARDETRLVEAAAEFEADHGVIVMAMAVDLSDPEGPADLYDRVASRDLAVSVLVNAAGRGVYGPVAETDLNDELGQARLNAIAPIYLTKRFLPGMLERGAGGVLNVASVAAFYPAPRMAGYHASKAHLLRYSEALAEELRGTGVTATALCPGLVETNFHDRSGMPRSRIDRRTMQSPAGVADAGYDGFAAGESIVVPGLRYRVLVSLLRTLPRSIVRRGGELGEAFRRRF